MQHNRRLIKIKKAIPFSFVLLLLLISGRSIAGGLFADVSYVGSSVLIAEQEFKPTLLQVGIGWQFTDRFAVQVSQASAESDDNVATVTSEIETMSSVMFRYGSPINGDVNVYVMGGHTDFDLKTTGNTLSSTENFAGSSWGVGFEERLSKNSDFRLHFDYVIHYNQDELKVESYQLGIRYVF